MRDLNVNFLNIENKYKILDGRDVFRSSHWRCSKKMFLRIAPSSR